MANPAINQQINIAISKPLDRFGLPETKFNVTVDHNTLLFDISMRNYIIDGISEYYIIDPSPKNIILATYSNNYYFAWFAITDEFTKRTMIEKNQYISYNKTTENYSILRTYTLADSDNINYIMRISDPFYFTEAILDNYDSSRRAYFRLISSDMLQITSPTVDNVAVSKMDQILLGTLILYNRNQQQ
ncbi:MAG: hypothetical protein Hyperionvirus18_25 [Hyperionvirus sp.]|uniref:Uncharacterized protein n=1 Tax=Hyperionvirus sp. TaxID=2487770 RepID=A0A3G5AFJ4_9VIRU|nr:MAG: hypothetical protein Hyperionvirus18_25 [Hyperionvirus sp.]